MGGTSYVAQGLFPSTIQPQGQLRGMVNMSLSLLPARTPEVSHCCEATAHGGHQSPPEQGFTPSSSRSSRPSLPEEEDGCPEETGGVIAS